MSATPIPAAELSGDEALAEARPGAVARFVRSPAVIAALAILVLIGLAALLAPLLGLPDPDAQDLNATLAGPSSAHWLGTDELGRDVLSRLIWGGRVSIPAAFEATAVALLLGVPAGLVAGYAGRVVDGAISWVSSVLLSMPAIIVLIAGAAVVGNDVAAAMVVLGVLLAPSFAYLVRGAVIAVRRELYVDAARVAGLSDARILLRHLLPVVRAPIIVHASLVLGLALLIQAGLSFIGLAEKPPTPSWGSMLAESSSRINLQVLLFVAPGLAISVSVLCLSLVGAAVRDAVEGGGDARPRPRPRRRDRGRGAHASLPAAAAILPTPRPVPADAALAVEQLTVAFPGPRGMRPVVDGVSLALRRGEVLGLLGESGSGKTMTALGVLGLIPPPGEIVAGRVRLGDTDLVGLPERELARLRGRRVALISQEPLSSLDPSFTVGFQLAEVMRRHRGMSKAQARERALGLLARVGLPDPPRVLRAYPHELSGGMAQRVMIALALSCEPDVLIADEPTTALDVTVQAEVLDLLRSLRDELGMAIVFVTHDLGVAAELCDRVAIMYAGQVVEEGPVADVFAQPEHPYTAALLASDPGAAGERLADIPGTVPPPHAWSDGCRFAARCAHARAECAQAVALRADGLPAARAVRCVRAEDLTLEGVA